VHQFDSVEPATDIACKSKRSFLTREGVTPQDRILDFGCAGGLFVRHLRATGYRESYGYDPYVDAYSDLSVLNDHYDVIVTWDVIEHVDEPRELLRKLTGLLNPGGLLLVSTPNADRLPLDSPNPLHIPELHQPYHRHILSDRALIELGRKEGLTFSSQINRSYIDTLYAFFNTRFLSGYVARRGGCLDVIGEMTDKGAQARQTRRGVLLRSPGLLFKAFFRILLRHQRKHDCHLPPPCLTLIDLRTRRWNQSLADAAPA